MTHIYSPHPPISDNPRVAASRAVRTSLSDTGRYPALPWGIADLPGTEWISIATFRRVTIGELSKAVDNYGQLGTWHGDRFIVENYVRWDVMPSHIQLRWHQAKVAAASTKLAEVKAELQEKQSQPKPTTLRAQKAQEKERQDCVYRVVAAQHALAEALADVEAATAREAA